MLVMKLHFSHLSHDLYLYSVLVTVHRGELKTKWCLVSFCDIHIFVRLRMACLKLILTELKKRAGMQWEIEKRA